MQHSDKPIILAFDTSTTACSVALQTAQQSYALHENIPLLHNQRLLDMIQTVLRDAELTFSDLDAIAVGTGPGSFVGTRIAVSVAQGIALASAKPLIPISTLQTIAQGSRTQHAATNAWVALDAHTQQVYSQAFEWDADAQLMAPYTPLTACAPEDLETPWETGCLLGDAWAVYAEKIPHPVKMQLAENWLPRATDMLTIATHQYQHEPLPNTEHVQPIYIRGNTPWRKQNMT